MKRSLGHQQFNKLFFSSKSLPVDCLLIKYSFVDTPKMGLIVSKKYGKSIQRNLFKRRCRALFIKFFKNHNLHLIIKPKRSSVSWTQLNRCFEKLHYKISKLN